MLAKEVTVVGSGQVRGAPDILNADIGIEVVAPDVSGAVSESNDKARQMIDAIVAAGVAPEGRTDKRSVRPAAVRRQWWTVRRRQRDRLPGRPTRYESSSAISTKPLLSWTPASRRAETRHGSATSPSPSTTDSQLLADARHPGLRGREEPCRAVRRSCPVRPLENVVTITEAHDTSGGQTMRAPDASMSDMVLAPGTQQVSFEVTVTWSLG